MTRSSAPPYGARPRVTTQEDSEKNARNASFPRSQKDFGESGGAFPELDVVQFPQGMGFSSRLAFDAKEIPASLGMSFKNLSCMAAKRAFGSERTTPEYLGFLKHVERCKRECEGDKDWQDCASSSGGLRDAIPVKRLRNVDPNSVGDKFLCDGDGEPVIIEDGGRDWDLRWGDFDILKKNLASFMVTCNDRAPARMTDAKEGLQQRTFSIALEDYLDYCTSRESALDPKRVPFYANGLRVFSEATDQVIERLYDAFPRPYFTSACDHTEMIVKTTLGHFLRDQSPSTTESTVSKSLDKMFISPQGAITRLHYDSGDAHGWLGQVAGRKLFVFYPPSSELPVVEESHSSLDPLNPELHNLGARLDPPYACVLAPGEIVLNPRKWWHYAVSLDERSVTVMRNFYNAGSNVDGLVKVIANSFHKSIGARDRAQDPANGGL
jgi:hypothetical protein